MSALGDMGYTPIKLELAQRYGQILVTDEAEDELAREWSEGTCYCEGEELCETCTAREMLGLKTHSGW